MTSTNETNLYPNQQRLKSRLNQKIYNMHRDFYKSFDRGEVQNFNRPFTIMVTGHMQSGKSKGQALIQSETEKDVRALKPWIRENTGAPMKGVVGIKSWLWMNINSKELLKQHRDKASSLRNYSYSKNENEELTIDDILNLKETLNCSTKQKKINEVKNQILRVIQQGSHAVAIVSDESHFGAGKDSKFAQFIKWFEGVPSMVPKYILCTTATLSMFNGVKLGDMKKELGIDILDIIEPPKVYWGTNVGGFIGSGREVDIDSNNYNMSTEEGAYNYVLNMFFPEWQRYKRQKTYKNFVLRLINSKDRERFENAINEVFTDKGMIAPQVFYCNSTKRADFGYEEFSMYCGQNGCKKKLEENRIIVIENGIAAGVSIDKSTIGQWYEKPEKRNKHKNDGIHNNSDTHSQRVGRNFGPNAGDYDYKILCDVKLLTDYQNQMDEIEKFCLSDGQINSDFTVQQTGTHTGNKISNQKFTMTHLRASTSREEIDTYSKSQCGKGIQSTSRSGTYDKDLGELILKDSLSGHSRNYGPSMKHPRRVFGYDDRYGFTMYIDEKAQNPNLKSCQDKIWKELANTPKWGNLQNKYVYIEMKDISGQKQIKSENNTCYPDFNKTNSKAS